ncbi:hypothetical protein KJ940_00755 [Myxococcota bacterium]|nr:hypothetical protein [Myxococcota bacterium]
MMSNRPRGEQPHKDSGVITPVVRPKDQLTRFIREIRSTFKRHCELLSHFPAISEHSIDQGLGFVAYDIAGDHYKFRLSGEIDSEALDAYYEKIHFLNQSFVLRVCSICEKRGIAKSRETINSEFDGFLSVRLLFSLKEHILRLSEEDASASMESDPYHAQAREMVNSYFKTLFSSCACSRGVESRQDDDLMKTRTIDHLIKDVIRYAEDFFGIPAAPKG